MGHRPFGVVRSRRKRYVGSASREKRGDVHKQRHRGPHPDDPRLFAAPDLDRLHRAGDEVVWLLGRGYSMESAVRVVGDHHQLEARQRLSLTRSCCAESARDARAEKHLDASALRGAELSIDGFNLVVTLEVALGGGVLLACRDGCLRDLAGLRGSYHVVDDTERAIALVREELESVGAAGVEIFLESAVSNAGRLRGLIERAMESSQVTATVTLVRDADPLLATRSFVISADAVVLDRAASWFNLARRIVDRHVPEAWRVSP